MCIGRHSTHHVRHTHVQHTMYNTPCTTQYTQVCKDALASFEISPDGRLLAVGTVEGMMRPYHVVTPMCVVLFVLLFCLCCCFVCVVVLFVLLFCLSCCFVGIVVFCWHCYLFNWNPLCFVYTPPPTHTHTCTTITSHPHHTHRRVACI